MCFFRWKKVELWTFHPVRLEKLPPELLRLPAGLHTGLRRAGRPCR
nr:MAG TPA: hypothetical protein [Caudoviricetes sp.]